MKYLKMLSVTVLLLLAYNCGTNKDNPGKVAKTVKQDLKIMEWVIGKWECDSKQGCLFEEWIKTNDSVFSGKSYLIANNDTVFAERISLELIQNELYYIPTVSNQNNGQAIRFKFVSGNNNEIVFENKAHDFPQRIIYVNPKPDSLYARIEGNDKGKFRKEEFFMVRSKR